MSRNRLEGAFARVLRAGEHIKDLRERIRTFSESEHETIIRNLQAGTVDERRGPLVKEPPVIISILLGEVIYNLRAALDYLIYALAWIDSGSPQKGTQFPIMDNSREFKSHTPQYLKGLNNRHITEIEQMQPYNENDWTKIIRDLSNPDKHRHLHAVMGQPFGFAGLWGTDLTSSTQSETINNQGNVYDSIHPDVTLDDGTPIVSTLKQLQEEVYRTLQVFCLGLKTDHCPCEKQ